MSASHEVSRREFLGSSAANAVNAAGVAAGVVGLAGTAVGSGANERVRVGVIGLRNRGRQLATALAAFPDVIVGSLCDVDPSQFEPTIRTADALRAADVETDHRRLFDDPKLDAVVIATPDHWHGAMAVDALRAGKDVYVEVPLTHRVGGGTRIVTAARDEGRIVQTGLTHRSGEHFRSAVDLVRNGGIGQVRLAKAWATHERKSIGFKRDADAPDGLDYAAWLGTAPARGFNPNRFHYNWRWFWDYGSGELGNWGVHLLDLARWGLAVGLPTRVASTGGKLYFNDDQETPDTQTVTYDYGHATLVWEHRHWSRRGIEGRSAGVAFYGDRGTLVVDRSGWKVYDRKDAPRSDGGDALVPHLRNFVDCIRTRHRPTADAGLAHITTNLVHLGNIAHRVGREIAFDPVTGTCPFDDEARGLLS